MPFRSEAQRKYMWAKHPEIAKRWTAKYGSGVVKKKRNVVDRTKKRRRARS